MLSVHKSLNNLNNLGRHTKQDFVSRGNGNESGFKMQKNFYGARNSQMINVNKPLFDSVDPKSSTEDKLINKNGSERKKDSKNYFNMPNVPNQASQLEYQGGPNQNKSAL